MISHNLETVQGLITNRKSYMGFRLVPKSVTLNDLERRNGRYIALFHRILWTCVKTHNKPRRSVAEFMHESIVFCSTCTMSS